MASEASKLVGIVFSIILSMNNIVYRMTIVCNISSWFWGGWHYLIQVECSGYNIIIKWSVEIKAISLNTAACVGCIDFV